MEKKTRRAAAFQLTNGTILTLQELLENLKKPKLIYVKIVQARTNYECFIDLSAQDRILSINELFNYAHAVIGYEFIPDGNYKSAMIDVFIRWILNSGYYELTEGEFQLALFYNTWAKKEQPDPIEFDRVEDSRATFNVNFFSKILINYKATRDNLDKVFINRLNGSGQHGDNIQ